MIYVDGGCKACVCVSVWYGCLSHMNKKQPTWEKWTRPLHFIESQVLTDTANMEMERRWNVCDSDHRRHAICIASRDRNFSSLLTRNILEMLWMSYGVWSKNPNINKIQPRENFPDFPVAWTFAGFFLSAAVNHSKFEWIALTGRHWKCITSTAIFSSSATKITSGSFLYANRTRTSWNQWNAYTHADTDQHAAVYILTSMQKETWQR